MPGPCPTEFRDDVVRVVRGREPGVRIEQIVKDLGVHLMLLQRWLSCAVVDEGARPGRTRAESVEVRELWKRNWFFEQENEVLRKAAVYLLQAYLPGSAGRSAAAKSSLWNVS